MVPSIPQFPRLHQAEPTDQPAPPDQHIRRLCEILRQHLGWPVHYEPPGGPVPTSDGPAEGAPAGGAAAKPATGPIQMEEGPALRPASRVDRRAVIEALNAWANDAGRLHAALVRAEAELAAAVPVICRGHDGARLAHRLECALKGLAEGLGCCAAGLYLLDDATTHLKLRSHWGLPTSRWLEPPRPLDRAIADLEALTGHAVVIEDSSLLRHWNLPESYPAAVCVPVSTPEIPLGTLWLFAPRPRDFSSEETNLVEIVAARLALELERQAMLRDVRSRRPMQEVAYGLLDLASSRFTPPQPVLEGWDVGLAGRDRDVPAADWCLWRMLADDRLALSFGEAWAPSMAAWQIRCQLEGALHATLLAGMPLDEMLVRLERLIAQLGQGDEQAAGVFAQVDLMTGEVPLQICGSISGYLVRPHGWELLAEPTAPLGATPAPRPIVHHQLRAGDVLLVIESASSFTGKIPEDHHRLAEFVLHYSHLPAAELARKVQQACSQPASILVLSRLDRSPADTRAKRDRKGPAPGGTGG